MGLRGRCEARTNPAWPGIARQCARVVEQTPGHILEGRLLCRQHYTRRMHTLTLIAKVNPNIIASA